MRSCREKIKGQEELRHIVEGLKKQGKRIVFTNGCFDLLHQGHVLYLEEARAKGDCLIVGVNSDSSIKEIKGADKPIVPQQGRMTVLAALEAVDYVTAFDEPDPLVVISELRPHILVKGGDWSHDEVVGRDLVEQTILVPFIEGASTSAIIETILRRHAS
jgi:rfaE bifunctional protein nucleotidyltransferase chain/domain